jgi:hypothetical protein
LGKHCGSFNLHLWLNYSIYFPSNLFIGIMIFILLSVLSVLEEVPFSGCWGIQQLILWGHILLKVVIFPKKMFWFGPLGLKIEEDLINRCWDIPLFIFCGLLPFKVASVEGHPHIQSYWFLFYPLSLSFKFEEVPISGCRDIQF